MKAHLDQVGVPGILRDAQVVVALLLGKVSTKGSRVPL